MMAYLEQERDQEGRAADRLMIALEPRYVFDAAAVATATDAMESGNDAHGGENQAANGEDAPAVNGEGEEAVAAADGERPRREIVFIDADVQDAATLIENVAPDAEVILLSADRDGVAQISATLAGYRDVDAVHIISHGEAGGIRLGSGELSARTVDQYAAVLAGWKGSLADGADLMLYGCDVAGSVEGYRFVDALARLTGADVAASIDKTGRAGDWDLEHARGEINTTIAVNARGRADFSETLGETIVITADNLGPGNIATADNDFGHSGLDGTNGIAADGIDDGFAVTTYTGGNSQNTIEFAFNLTALPTSSATITIRTFDTDSGAGTAGIGESIFIAINGNNLGQAPANGNTPDVPGFNQAVNTIVLTIPIGILQIGQNIVEAVVKDSAAFNAFTNNDTWITYIIDSTVTIDGGADTADDADITITGATIVADTGIGGGANDALIDVQSTVTTSQSGQHQMEVTLFAPDGTIVGVQSVFFNATAGVQTTVNGQVGYDIADVPTGTLRAQAVLIRVADGATLDTDNANLQHTQGTGPTNLPPSNIALSNGTVPENSPGGTLIGSLTATDALPNPDTHTFEIVGTDSRFEIDGSNLVVKNGADLNFEATNSFSVTIKATDAGGLSFQKAITVLVSDVNEIPTDIIFSNTVEVIPEDSPNGTRIADLSGTDTDNTDTQTFSVVGPEAAGFTVIGTRLVVRDTAQLDFETKTTHVITVRVTDKGGLTRDEEITVRLTDVTEGGQIFPPPPPPPPPPTVNTPTPTPPPPAAPVLRAVQAQQEAARENPADVLIERTFEFTEVELRLERGIDDQYVEAGEINLFRVPGDAFVHSEDDQALEFEAKQASGQSLPQWLSFDPDTVTFNGTPPEGLIATFELVVVARDEFGNEAEAKFTLTVGESDEEEDQQRSRQAQQPDQQPTAGAQGQPQPQAGEQTAPETPQAEAEGGDERQAEAERVLPANAQARQGGLLQAAAANDAGQGRESLASQLRQHGVARFVLERDEIASRLADETRMTQDVGDRAA